MLVTREKYIGICGVCGGPRHSSGGRVCLACYSKPEVRRTYLNHKAPSPLPYGISRLELITFERKPSSGRRPKEFYEKLRGVAPAVKLLSLPENTWRDDGSIPIYRAPRKPRLPRIYKPVERRINLVYPYVAKPRDEHADLLAVNALIPQMPGREDICQEIMLALWEGRITLDQIKTNRTNLRPFIRSFTKENYESGGYAISLDVPMHSGQSWHDVLVAPEPYVENNNIP